METIDRNGNLVTSVTLASPVGSLAGDASIGFFADFDRDGDIDLMDVGNFQRCFAGQAGAVRQGCEPGDRNADGHVDLYDFSLLPTVSTGP